MKGAIKYKKEALPVRREDRNYKNPENVFPSSRLFFNILNPKKEIP